MSHADNCILSSRCKLAGSAQCNRTCSAFIALHGYSTTGGRIANANAPSDYRLLTLNSSPARETQTKVYATLEKYIATFNRVFEPDSPRIKSLYLYSESPGNGKTTTAIAVMNEWIMRYYYEESKRSGSDRQATQQRPAYFLDCNDWQTLFNEFNRSNIPREVAEPASREYYRRMQAAKTAPFVVIDDLGIRSASEAFRSDLHSVINYRVVNGLPVIYTSNLPMFELENVFDARLYDRIKDQCLEIHFEGSSFRGKRKGGK